MYAPRLWKADAAHAGAGAGAGVVKESIECGSIEALSFFAMECSISANRVGIAGSMTHKLTDGWRRKGSDQNKDIQL